MARIPGRGQVVADLERGGGLPVDAVRVDRIDQRDRMVPLLGHLANDPQRVVEVAIHGDNPRSGGHRLDQLAECDLAFGRTTITSSPQRRRRQRRTPTCCR